MFGTVNEEELNKYNLLVEKYKKLSEKLRINKEIDQITLEIEKLKVKADLEEMDYTQEIKELELRLDVLKEETNEDPSKSSIELLDKKNKIQVIRSRLAKLEDKKNQISENVYMKLKKEYEDEIDEISHFINQEKSLIADLNKKSSDFIANYSVIREEIDIRYNLSDISEQEYKDKIHDLSKAKSSAESLHEITQLLLEEIDR